MWRKLLFRERRMWRVLRIIILPIYKNGELCDGEFCEFCELCYGELCDGEFCEFSELCHGEFSHGELCEFSEFSHGEFSELCYGEFCEFSECCETYVSYVLMSKNSGRREHELMSKNSGRRGRKWTYVLMSKKRWRELRKICVTLRSLLLGNSDNSRL